MLLLLYYSAGARKWAENIFFVHDKQSLWEVGPQGTDYAASKLKCPPRRTKPTAFTAPEKE